MSRITFESFDLPFDVEDDEEEQPSGKSEQLEFLQGKVPAKCIFLGEINSELDRLGLVPNHLGRQLGHIRVERRCTDQRGNRSEGSWSKAIYRPDEKLGF